VITTVKRTRGGFTDVETLFFKLGELPGTVYSQWLASIYFKVSSDYLVVRLKLLVNDEFLYGPVVQVLPEEGWKEVQMIVPEKTAPPTQFGVEFIEGNPGELYIARPYLGRIGWSRVLPLTLGSYKSMRSYWVTTP